MTRSTTVSKASIRRVPAKAGPDEIISTLQEDGVVIIESFCAPKVVDQLNNELEPYLAHDNNLPQAVADFHGQRSKRIGNLTAKSKTFRDNILNDTLLHDICRTIYTHQQQTDYWMSASIALELAPGGDSQIFHRDQVFFPLAKALGKIAPMVLMNFFIALSDVTAENGGTRVIPGSHLWPDFNDHGNPEMAVPVQMKAGDAFLLGGKTVHSAGPNLTADSYRRVIVVGLQPGYLTPVETFFGIRRDVVESMTPLARRMVGWGSPKVDGVTLWTSESREIDFVRDRDGEGEGEWKRQKLRAQ